MMLQGKQGSYGAAEGAVLLLGIGCARSEAPVRLVADQRGVSGFFWTACPCYGRSNEAAPEPPRTAQDDSLPDTLEGHSVKRYSDSFRSGLREKRLRLPRCGRYSPKAGDWVTAART